MCSGSLGQRCPAVGVPQTHCKDIAVCSEKWLSSEMEFGAEYTTCIGTCRRYFSSSQMQGDASVAVSNDRCTQRSALVDACYRYMRSSRTMPDVITDFLSVTEVSTLKCISLAHVTAGAVCNRYSSSSLTFGDV